MQLHDATVRKCVVVAGAFHLVPGVAPKLGAWNQLPILRAVR